MMATDGDGCVWLGFYVRGPRLQLPHWLGSLMPRRRRREAHCTLVEDVPCLRVR